MTALCLYRNSVRSDWVDYNGHMRDAYYLLAFSLASDALIERIGLDEAERQRSQRSVYTLEVHLNYLRELKLGEPLRVEAQLLGHDSKRLHVYFSLYRGDDAEPAAVSEQMLMHIDTGIARGAAFSPAVLAQVQQLAASSAGPWPAYAGRVIALPGAARQGGAA
ncbi:thioesterase family protein [Vogesella sp. LIG4]|uniref:thioesterase family protein n=1 Tax=Vogesella sp. LIG4 TaxID=1192162 RepID=UPI00081FE983|nr:thioesterase family protein [Vogesella sp. LIG4]SCK15613.1 acyl-CoA thioester hydrolase [Vogesella sp. LIG4]